MRFLIIIILLNTIGCTRFFYKDIREESPELYKENITPDPKIKVLGFYPFKVVDYQRGLRKNKIIAELDYDNSLKEEFLYYDKENSISKNPKKQKLDFEYATRFINGYLNFVGKSGIKEIETIINLENKQFYLINKNYDYYILGIFGPDFKRRKIDDFKGTFTKIFCFLTLGIIPAIEEFDIEGSFYLFDKNLKLVSSMYYPQTYKTITSLWMWPNEGFYTFFNSHDVIPKGAYKDLVQRINIDFENLKNLKKQKASPDLEKK
ncbi:MAG: hypothetical protein KDK36_22395 [Leptospiraceae bacterium]|nr:hypothetical protein [Leptospiraceae bacterium]